MISFVSKFYLNAKKRENQKVAQKEFAIINQQFEESLEEFDDETKQLEQELFLRQKKRFEDLQNAHQIELDEFEERWTSEQKVRIYNKSTSGLNTMRRRITFLLVANRFEEAEVAQKDVDVKTQQEESENYYKMQHDYDESLNMLRQKQYQELQSMKSDCNIEFEKFHQDRKKLKQGFLNRKFKLQAKKDIIDDPDKLWAHRKTERFANTGKSLTNKSMTLEPSSKMKFSDFPEPEVESLVLPPLESHIKTNYKSSRR